MLNTTDAASNQSSAAINGGSGGAGGGNGGQFGGSGGGGAGGGAVLLKGSGAYNNAGTLLGGNGGAGAVGQAVSGGSGGDGGAGAVLTGASSLTNQSGGEITGGSGGVGGNSNFARTGNGGSGGAGVLLINGGDVNNSGTIIGGAGGAAGTASNGSTAPGMAGAGGAGIAGSNISIINAGTISGGLGGGGTQAAALQFTGGDNFLAVEGSSWRLDGNIDIQAGTLTFKQSDKQTVANIITGDGTLIQDGEGTLTLTGANTYTGGTEIADSHTLGVGHSSALGSGTVTMDDGSTLAFKSDGLSLANGFKLNSDSTFSVSLNQTATISGIVDDDTSHGLLSLDGGGTLVLTNLNTYTGETWIDEGTLALSGSGSIASSSNVDICDCGALDISGTNSGATIQSLSGFGRVKLGDKTLTLSNASGVYEGSIEGAGGLVISDGGAEYLYGDNSYQGGTSIGANAVVAVGKDSSLGTGTVAISDSTYLIFDADGLNLANNFKLSGETAFWMDSGHIETLSGIISDGTSAGSLGIAGDGKLVLTNINTYTGPTWITSGTVALSGAGSIANSSGVDLCDCATFDISATNNGATIQSLEGEGTVMLGSKTLTLGNASGDYSGVIQGEGGGLTVNGGKLTLDGANTYTGSTTINTGTLALADAGSISASSGIAIHNGGTFDISATTSGATIQNLEGDNGTVMLGGKALTLANASGAYSGVIQGAGGSLLKNGTGTLTLNGINTYTGGTMVNAGTLEVGDADHPSASIQGAVAVNNGGTLRGHGSIAGNVDSTGIVWPGGSIGTLTIGGNYSQSPDGTLQIEVSPTEASQLKVGGTASLAGTLNLLYGPGTYTSRSYPILSAKAVNGTFSSVTANNPTNVEYKVLYDALGVNLDVTALVVAPTQATIFGAMGSSALRAGQAANDILLSRLAGPCGTTGAASALGNNHGAASASASPSSGGASLACPQTNGLWIQAQGTDTRIDGNHGAPDVRDQHYGFLTGFDHAWRGMTVGLAGGYSHGEVSESGNGSRGTLDTLRIAGYAAKNIGPYTLAGTLGYAYDFASTTRSFGALGSAKGDGHGQEFSAGLQASRTWQLSPAVTLTPRIGIRYAYLGGLGTDESGPTAQNLGVGNQHRQSLQPYAGLTLDYRFTLPNSARPASVQLRAGYAYETQSLNRNVSVTAADGTGFTIAGTRDSRGQLTAGLGTTLPLGKTTSAYLRYDAWLHTGNVNAQALQAGVDYRF
ncbi:MAG TPA: autotransporter domain-containing protein [Eoetvoesiella sp.]|uniref:autotransporter domain-containing protein n=1 Tax=Eoetvoesiella sp. TaxID=1966355 RepID=UPI002C8237C0|nr:autotransporter domain-containing protein [Eoetvoesiella sp.]HWK62509.1 autotransporter domain-containing protein [Eoetvoesiella sp.]